MKKHLIMKKAKQVRKIILQKIQMKQKNKVNNSNYNKMKVILHLHLINNKKNRYQINNKVRINNMIFLIFKTKQIIQSKILIIKLTIYTK